MFDYEMLEFCTNDMIVSSESLEGSFYESTRTALFDYVSGNDLDIMTEGGNIDSLKAFSAFKKNFKPECKVMRKAIKEKRWPDASNAAKKCAKLVSDAKKEINSLTEDDDWNAAALGRCIVSAQYMAAQYAATLVGVAVMTTAANTAMKQKYGSGMRVNTGSITSSALKQTTKEGLKQNAIRLIAGDIIQIFKQKKKGEKIKAADFNELKRNLVAKLDMFEKQIIRSQRIIAKGASKA